MKQFFISVCKNVIQGNNKRIREGSQEPLQPPIRIQRGMNGEKIVCNHAELLDNDGNVLGTIRYQADKAIIKCGAKVVIEWNGGIREVS